MATKFAAREDLVLATEDDCSGRSNSENREGIDGAIHTSSGKISTEGLEDVGAVMGEAIAALLKMGCFRTAFWGVCMSTPLLLLIGCSLSHHLRV